jgi:ribosomal protein L37AE/L43A
MTETAYVVDFHDNSQNHGYHKTQGCHWHYTDVYHERGDCSQLKRADTTEMPADCCRESSQLRLCKVCQSLSGETVKICPECEDSDVHVRTNTPPVRDWRCGHCDAIFREPDERPRQTGSSSIRGIARELLNADAEEVSRDE